MSRNKTNYKKLFCSFVVNQVCMSLQKVLKNIFTLIHFLSHFDSVTNLSDYEGDLSFMDDDIDEITYTNSNQNRRSLTGTSITSMSEDRRSISTLNQQNFEEIVQDDDAIFRFNDE